MLSEMGWMSLENNLILANAKMTHKIVYQNIPEIISQIIKSNFAGNILPGGGIIGQKPANIGHTKVTKCHYWTNAFRVYAMLPEVITEIQKPHILKKWTIRFPKNPNDIPKNKKITPQQHPT